MQQAGSDSEQSAKRRRPYHSGQGEVPDNSYAPPALGGQPSSSADRLATKCIGKSLLLITSTVEQRDANGVLHEVLQVFLEGHHDLKGIFADQVEGNADLWSIKPEFYTKLADAHFKNTKQEEVHRYKNISDNLGKATRDELVEHITKLLRDWVDAQPVDPGTGRKPSSKQPFKFRPIPDFWPDGVTYSSDAVHNRANKQQLTYIAEHLVKWKLQRLDQQHLGPAALLPAPPPPVGLLQDAPAPHPAHGEGEGNENPQALALRDARDPHAPAYPDSPQPMGPPADVPPHRRMADNAAPRAAPRQAAAAGEASTAAAAVMLGLQPPPQDDYPSSAASTRPAPAAGAPYDESEAPSDQPGGPPSSRSHLSAAEQRSLNQAANYSGIPLFQADTRELLPHMVHPGAPPPRRLDAASAAQTLAALRRTEQLEEQYPGGASAAAAVAAQMVYEAAAVAGVAGGQASGGHMAAFAGSTQPPPAAAPPGSPGQL